MGCVNLINTAPESVSDDLIYISNGFYKQYEGCSSITAPSIECQLPASCISDNTSHSYGYRGYQYKNCTSLLTCADEKELPAA
jgi:hypothetical protein